MENKVLATVNGAQITEKDLEEAIMRFPNDRRGYLNTDNGKKQLLEEMIAFELIYNYAKESGFENDESYIGNLETAKKEILTQTAISKLMSEVNVKDSEVEDYYKVNKDKFVNPESVVARHILVETKEKANDVLKEINEGMSFEEAAKKYSSCPSKAQGGNLGQFTRGQMVPEFEEAAFSLGINVISEPVKTQFGYHLIKVERKTEASPKSYEQVKNTIKNNLLQQRQSYKYNELNKQLKEKYTVEYEK
ncbi:peptidylprolyl isomerase [Clostridium fermenticellae]|uniref:Peptidylprolyl isomerase n=1 Tax=Clostridium fermenticellae TaxID=2068654 RepID=A0A386H0B2_9CLOT|nr:peptidylprolyl isomerase [Clostridium fermenticellae]AYD39094.1 peptidylprolyl isomerase [Clostridium fermenticellae]